MLLFKLQGIVWDLSIMRLSYKLKKRTTKTEKMEKSFKMFKLYNSSNFKTIRSKLTALAKNVQSILIHKLMGPVSFLLLPKE